MSSNIQQNLDYLKLLLSTDTIQQRALISTITPEQVDVLSEIFHNLLTLPLTPAENKFVKARGLIIKKLGDTSKTQRYHKSQLNKHSRQVVKTLIYFKDKLWRVLVGASNV
jgi:hypothetical protein